MRKIALLIQLITGRSYWYFFKFQYLDKHNCALLDMHRWVGFERRSDALFDRECKQGINEQLLRNPHVLCNGSIAITSIHYLGWMKKDVKI